MTEQVQDLHTEALAKILADGMSPSEERAAIEQILRTTPGLATPILFTVLGQKQHLRALVEQTEQNADGATLASGGLPVAHLKWDARSRRLRPPAARRGDRTDGRSPCPAMRATGVSECPAERSHRCRA